MKAVVLCDWLHGNTKAVAEAIAAGLPANEAFETGVAHVGDIGLEKVVEHDIILIGSPNHFGGSTGRVKRLIQGLRGRDLSGKEIAVFDTCFRADVGKATRTMEERLRKAPPERTSSLPVSRSSSRT